MDRHFVVMVNRHVNTFNVYIYIYKFYLLIDETNKFIIIKRNHLFQEKKKKQL